jgi:Zn-dependent protease
LVVFPEFQRAWPLDVGLRTVVGGWALRFTNKKDQSAMFRSWKLGSAFGIGIFVHWSFLFLPAYVLLTNGTHGGWPLALFLLLLVAAVFACVVLHELGHALMARAFGIGTRDITLYPIGGVARLERMSEKPWEELCIALAGPAVNAALAVILLGVGVGVLGLRDLAGFLNTPEELAGLWGVRFLFNLLGANVMLGLFNLLPAFPMDGGRVLRALLSWPLGRLQATEIAASIGVVMALLLAVAAFFVNPMLLVLAGFVFFAGRQELAALRRRHAEAMDVVSPDGEVIDVEPGGVRPPFSGVLWDRHLGMWVVWRDGRPVGMFSAYSE